MADTIRIEIPIEVNDETNPGLNNILKGLLKLGETANKTSSSTKKAGETVTQFDKSAQKTQKSLSKWAKEKYQILLEAKDKVSPILSVLKSGVKSFSSKAWKVTLKAVDLVTSPVRGILNLLRNPLFQVGAILGVSIGLTDTINTYKEFEAMMSKVQAISSASSEQLEKLTKKAKEMGATTKFTATQAGEAFSYMAMAGWKTEDMLNGIEGIMYLAGASGEDLGTTSDIVTDALTAFGMKASDASHFADVLAVASSNANTNVAMMGETFKYVGAASGALGYSIDDVALGIGLMANSGIKASQAGTELNSIFTRLSTNTNGATDAIKKLGIKFFDSSGNARAFSKILVELRQATRKMTKEEKMNFANTVAGTRAQAGLLAMLNATTDDFNKLTKSIENADGAAVDMYNTMQDNLQGSLDSLNSKMEAVKLSFGERLAPYVKELAEWIGNQMPAIEQGLNEWMDWIDTKVNRLKRKFDQIKNTEEWENADFVGKIKIAWDEFIVEPFSKWWKNKGKGKLAEIIGDIGEGIGSGLKFGIMTLLGIDFSDTIDEGVSIGRSFAKGFSDGFDINTILGKLGEGISHLSSNALKLLPGGKSADLSSILSLGLLTKIATPFLGIGKGALHIGKKVLFGKGASGISLIDSLIGDTGNAMIGGSGLLGKLANIGYELTGGAETSTLSGSKAALAGGRALAEKGGMLAGGVAAGATLISSVMDLYKAKKSTNQEEKSVYTKSAAWKAGGVAAGATIGTLILPGFGTAVGAGIGGLIGWLKGNSIKKKYEEKYQEDIEKIQREAEKAQKVFQATGLAIEEVKFANKDLERAIEDTEVSAEQFALLFQEDCANVMKAAFGDIRLSLSEVQTLVEKITFGDMKEELEEFQLAVTNTESSLNTLKSSVSNLKKENWKVNLGMKLSESEKEGYKSTIDHYVQAAEGYIKDNHYEATVAIELLVGESRANRFTSGLDKMYTGFYTQLKETGTELQRVVSEALSDGIISTEDKITIKIDEIEYELDEASAIAKLYEKITEITNQVAEAKSESSLDLIRIKYGSGKIDAESFANMQEELKAYSEDQVASLDHAYQSASISLKLQLNDETLTTEEKQEIQNQLKELEYQYEGNINRLNKRVESFNLDMIVNTFGKELEGILPQFQGTMAERLEQAIEQAILIQPDISSWMVDGKLTDQMVELFDLDGLDVAVATNVASLLQMTANSIPKQTKQQFLQSFQAFIPTTEEIAKAIDFTKIGWVEYDKLLGGTGEILSSTPMLSPILSGTEADFEQQCQMYAQAIHDTLKNSSVKEVMDFIHSYMPDLGNLRTESQKWISEEYSQELLTQCSMVGMVYGNSITTGMQDGIIDNSPLLRNSIHTAIDSAVSEAFTVTAKVNLLPIYHFLGNTTFPIPSISKVAGNHATGGYVSGKQLSWVGEEGPEAIIPLVPSRRSRAVDLYQEVGNILGIDSHAIGGIVGSFQTGENSFQKIEKGDSFPTQIPIRTIEPSYYKDTPIQVNVQMTPEITIYRSSEEEDIEGKLQRNMKEIANDLGYEIATKLEQVFSNLPLKQCY